MFLSRDEIAKCVIGRPRDIGRPITPALTPAPLSVRLSACLYMVSAYDSTTSCLRTFEICGNFTGRAFKWRCNFTTEYQRPQDLTTLRYKTTFSLD